MAKFERLDDLKLNESKKYLDLIKSDKKVVSSFFSNGRVKQIDLYCLLKSKYGKPNGLMTFLRGNHSNNFVQWDYTFKLDNLYLNILGSERFLEFRIISEFKFEDLSEDKIISVFKEEISKNRSEISKEKKNLEYWDIFTNTYKRLKMTIDEFYDKYCKIIIKEPYTINKTVITKAESNRYNHQMKILTKKIVEKKNYGLVLRMFIPVMGESLINLIIFLLLKNEIKNDKRLLENVFRSQIDIRIKTMHLNCIGISKPYDQNDNRFKEYLRIMNKRNDFLHGNVMPAENCFDNVFFDGTIPIFNQEKDMSIEFLKQNMFQVDESQIRKEYKDLLDFKKYLLDNIDTEIKEQVELTLEKSELGYNKSTKRMGILFDDEMFQSFLIRK